MIIDALLLVTHDQLGPLASLNFARGTLSGHVTCPGQLRDGYSERLGTAVALRSRFFYSEPRAYDF